MRFKAKSRKQFKLAFANSSVLGIRLSENIAAGDWRLLFLHRDAVAKLTVADVQKTAAAYLMASNRTLGMFTPAKAPLTVRRTLAAYPASHPLYTPTTDESIAGLKALRLADIKKLAALLGTSNATMTVLGDVDTAAVRPWLDKTWGSWKSPRPWKRLERKYTATTGSEQTLDFPDKANTLIAAVHAVDMKDDDADVPAMSVADYALGGGGFVSRLVTRLRQKDGLSYFAFSQLQLFPLDAAGGFIAGGGLNPENAKKGMAAMLEEITNLVSGGITADELVGAKQGLLSSFERNLSNDVFVLGMCRTDSTSIARWSSGPRRTPRSARSPPIRSMPPSSAGSSRARW